MSDVDLLSKLNLEQQAAVTHTEGPLMIIAGAGTGKTTAITHRIAWLIDQGHAKPEEILALTFTDKAAGEMEERVDRLLPYGYVDLQISTFHSFAETLLRKYGAELGLARDFRLMNELDAWLLTRQHLDRFELGYYRPLGNPTKYIRSLLVHFSRAKDSAIDPEIYADYVVGFKTEMNPSDEEQVAEFERLDELARAYATYQQLLLDHDALDFGDLMLYTLKLLRERPAIRKEIRETYKYVLVDEFQDTNDAQYEIVKEIAAPRNNLTVVGDDDQSIYKFRGASLSNILQFESDYSDATRVVLTTNYRSAQEILDYSHGFIQHNNPNRLEADPKRNLSKKLTAGVEDYNAEISHLHGATLDEEVRMVVDRIKELKSASADVAWSDFAILVRSNTAGSDFAAALEQHKVPYQFMALSGLYTKPVILDMLAYLRCIDNPFDSPSFFRLLTSPICGVSDRGIMELNRFARRKGKSLFEACEQANMIHELSPEDADIIRTVLHNLSEFQSQARNRRVNELFVMVAKDSGYLEYLNTKSEQAKLEAFGYLQQFHERLKSFVRRHDHPVLHHFLNEFTHERDAGEEGSLSVDLEAGPNVVKIMTIHASKGLEFRHVFIVNMVAQRFPTRAKSDAIPLPLGLGSSDNHKEGHLEEERRLFYVAMTRAKEGLYFTSAADYGGARKRKISRFLHELGYEQPVEKSEEVVELFDEERGPDAQNVDPNAPVTFAVPKQFSFTQLAAFRSCPLQYKFAHVLKIPVMGKWTFSYGKTMHNTLQRFFERWLERTGQRQATLFDAPAIEEGELPVSYPELLDIYDASWIDEWYVSDKQRSKYREQGKQSLKAFYASLDDDLPQPLSIEQGFTMKFGSIVLKGRIDRMDLCEDGVEIIDYKTGKPKTSLSSDDKEQLLLYQLAAKDVLGLNVKKLTFHYLQDNSKVSFLGTDTQLLNLQDSLVERVQQIKDSSFLPTPGFHCRFCDFADICEYRQ